MENTLIQWHPAFVAAMKLELAENRMDLYFEGEHNLNTAPLEVDLLIIKKSSSVKLKNEIGKFFKQYNLLEYKSPGDQLDIDVLYKVIGYACLYKSYGKGVDGRPAKDITVSFVREAKPLKLFQYLQQHKTTITNPYPGIYYIKTGFLFPIQMIITKELKSSAHIILQALTRELKKEHLFDLLNYAKSLKEKSDRDLMDSVLEASMQANEQAVRKWRGDDIMCQALLNIMEPEINKIKQQAIENALRKGELLGQEKGMKEGRKEEQKESIRHLIDALLEVGMNTDKVRDMVLKRYPLAEDEINQYLDTM